MTMLSLTHRFIQKSLMLVCGFVAASLSAQVGVNQLDGNFKALTLSGDRLVAIDLSNDDSEIFTSDDDGVSFTSRYTSGDNYEALAAVGNTVIAVGDTGLVLRSADSGSTWAEAIAPVLFGSLRSVAGRTDGANENQWIAVGDNGLDSFVYQSTDDGQNWTKVEEINNLLIEDVIWTGNRWLLCGGDTSFYEGSIYSSTDGVSWAASTVPVGAAALLAMSHDGAGVVVAVGEMGQVLRSTDDGLTFATVAANLLSEDLYAVIVDSSGTFYLGGVGRTIIELNGTSASFLVPPAASAAPVLDFVLIDEVPFAVSETGPVQVRTIPLDLLIAPGGTQDFQLSVSESLSDKVYFLQTSVDLVNWGLVSENSTVGNNAALSFDVAEDELKRFWRVVEF